MLYEIQITAVAVNGVPERSPSTPDSERERRRQFDEGFAPNARGDDSCG